MDFTIFVVSICLIVWLLRGAIQTQGEPEYVLVRVEPPRRGAGCSSLVVLILLVVFITILVMYTA